jgi:hypothetical protein
MLKIAAVLLGDFAEVFRCLAGRSPDLRVRGVRFGVLIFDLGIAVRPHLHAGQSSARTTQSPELGQVSANPLLLDLGATPCMLALPGKSSVILISESCGGDNYVFRCLHCVCRAKGRRRPLAYKQQGP